MAGGSHGHQHGGDGTGNLKLAFFLNFAFTLVEIAGGLWTNSIAILSDALHDGGDSLSIGLSWYLQKRARQDPNALFTYGYRRFSVLGALITGLVLVVGLGIIVWHAVERIMTPAPVRVPGMIGLALLGIAVNGFAAWRTRRGRSLNEKMVSWHLLEDVLGWGAVLLGAVAMAIWDLPVLDPLLSIGISLFVLWNVGRNLRGVLGIILQRAPESFDADIFQKRINALPGVVSSHHVHTWTLDGEHHVLSAHIVMAATSDRTQIAEAKQRLREELAGDAFEHVTIDVELEGEECFGCH